MLFKGLEPLYIKVIHLKSIVSTISTKIASYSKREEAPPHRRWGGSFPIKDGGGPPSEMGGSYMSITLPYYSLINNKIINKLYTYSFPGIIS